MAATCSVYRKARIYLCMLQACALASCFDLDHSRHQTVSTSRGARWKQQMSLCCTLIIKKILQHFHVDQQSCLSRVHLIHVHIQVHAEATHCMPIYVMKHTLSTYAYVYMIHLRDGTP